ncbi:MAG: ABC transporter substrate-binding protein [Lachnospiraceae bacterium]|jgi:iron complex transport system substrate-binding protein|nr:ABC transporter substrate-binding protein [Lachnospiraceae bacterium]MCH4063915.1 ABC transporter substrate-binding protein [Lachnospiraceae bacterium]MCH4103363.1 ABC transporter substrate-binding protein [Lachnospiraceae bacterium]MCI1309312.1 ABC transporter substrate-binding protein [Lachnospiraceae bacterium]MCI1333675.1 ABC transporter substrate-binding protein [Lachnospiraceae bacterium]
MKRILAAALAAMLLVSGCGAAKTDGTSAASGQTVVSQAESAASSDTGIHPSLADGTYETAVTLTGGSGRASVESPAEITVKDGKISAKIVWSSPYYDYMIVDGVKYENEAKSGNSTFTIPVSGFQYEMPVIADTTAMSEPHEIDYTLNFAVPGSASDAAAGDASGSLGSSSGGDMDESADSETSVDYQNETLDYKAGSVSIDGLTYTDSMDVKYAKQFAVDWYMDEDSHAYALIFIGSDQKLLLVPEDGSVPSDLPDDITVLRQPLNKTYLVSTSAMDPVQAIGAIGNIRFSGTKESGWYVSAAADAMKKGDILYAGKYSAPDYESLLGNGCNFAIENTMIYHDPSVLEMLKSLGIPAMVERSSYETEPLGRLEWVRLYGVLFDKRKEADVFFDKEVSRIKPLANEKSTGKTVAFFSVTSNGSVTVRKPGDYISKIISMAGGTYIFDSLDGEDENALSTMNMQMEDFYAGAKDADVLIYNGTIEGEVSSIAALEKKNALFKNFAAVKSREVYSLGPECFQQSTNMAALIQDIHDVLHGDAGDMTYLTKLS